MISRSSARAISFATALGFVAAASMAFASEPRVPVSGSNARIAADAATPGATVVQLERVVITGKRLASPSR